jgi:hypothetical protein
MHGALGRIVLGFFMCSDSGRLLLRLFLHNFILMSGNPPSHFQILRDQFVVIVGCVERSRYTLIISIKGPGMEDKEGV